MSRTSEKQVRQLASMLGVQLAYYDVDGVRTTATTPNLLAAVRALGAPVTRMDDVPLALREVERGAWDEVIDPVIVAWVGQQTTAELRLPAQSNAERVKCTLAPGDANEYTWELRLADARTLRQREVDEMVFVVKEILLPKSIPMGYHRLAVQLGDRCWESLVVSAPRRTFNRESEGPSWGVFAPLYGLRSDIDWGIGDYTTLGRFANWVAEYGATMVATLPLLATFYDEPWEPSPYAPVSRLYWNELYVDVAAVSEAVNGSERSHIASLEVLDECARLRAADKVDYNGVRDVKRRALEELAQRFFSRPTARYEDFVSFVRSRPGLEDYSRFRAAGEKFGRPWQQWPQRQREGSLTDSDFREEDMRYHMYVQWLAEEQLQEASSKQGNASLQLDLPLGTHTAGYDVWSDQDLFVHGGTVGAPPDTFFRAGQNWGFKLVKPHVQRSRQYSYFIQCLQHHLRYADRLRIDHVMSLHRLFFIPEHAEAKDGVYVKYPAEELYAIISLESHRHRAPIVGEDLGTVPRAVRAAISKHGMQRSYVMQIEPSISNVSPFGHIPARSTAMLNTHDTSSFAAFWTMSDIDDRLRLNLISAAAAVEERNARRQWHEWLVRFLLRNGLLDSDQPTLDQVLDACLTQVSASRAACVQVNLEDLWLELNAQNVPGTFEEHPNWCHRLRYTLEKLSADKGIANRLAQVDRARTRGETDAA